MSMDVAAETQWVTTTATKDGKASGEPYGWRLHAVEASPTTRFSEMSDTAAACGLRAEWGMDLFIVKKCARCLRRLRRACLDCHGTGLAPRDATCIGCSSCRGTGERPGR